jgi:ATP-dependent DNA helicase RecG
MYREMIRSGQEVPLIEDGTDYVRVVLSGGAPRTSISRFVAQLPAEEREDTDAMLVLYTLCRRRTVSSVTMAPILQKGEAETELILRRLSHDTPGILEPTRESARARRRQFRLRGDALRALGTAVRYNRRTIDETDRKVVSHVAEYGRVTNRTLQNMFDIDVFRARDLLADLQARGILVRTSEATRGRNVEYGPGSKFPRPRRRLPHKAPTKDQ